VFIIQVFQTGSVDMFILLKVLVQVFVNAHFTLLL
jgi:hypothetical protein